MTRASAAAAALLRVGVFVGGCDALGRPDAAQGDDAALTTLADTAATLADIHSAAIEVELLAESPDMGEDARLGFRLDGFVQLPDDEGELPVAELTYTQIAGANEGTATFVAVDGELYVTAAGVTTQLPPDQASGFARQEGDDEGLSELRIDDWIVAPTLEEEDDIATVRGELDLAAFYAGLAELSGGALPALDDDDVAQLDAAVQASTIEVAAGADDHFLRAVVIDITFGSSTPDDVPGLTPGATAHFELRLDAINEPVDVDAPTDAVPADEVAPPSPT